MNAISCKEAYRDVFRKLPALLNQRFISNAETLEHVDLSYATYENTISESQAAPFVVMHGLLGSKANWNSLCKVFQKKTEPQRKIIAADMRNHGDSVHTGNHTYAHMVADMKALFDKLKISKAALIGHSMGGRTAMLFALKYPELVDRLIVADISPIGVSAKFKELPGILQALETANIPSGIPMSQVRASVDQQLSSAIPDKLIRIFLLTNLIQKNDDSYGWRVNLSALVANFNNLGRFPLLSDIQYKGPVLFIGGGNSDYLPKSDYPKILQLFPNAELKYIDGAGHWLHTEKPEEFLKLTLNFLNRKEEAAS